eukprot:CAMPEP_0172566498 /NCGR_PEP_ID=MMETSP1067-20121228/112046_1 /TAXON_ID=265564 ORGANISM="Thalassiosira punctigera, Strain Tpunct2005C2" /NCGR_SAMPLE_ID=MMETSP1067 /ASSEMBLY_ACC=CAM_ASM_000444 /LENGTH=32 /DNA_ID= /DNA_START= /DNA_END= /DNA_ORIENTATION=
MGNTAVWLTPTPPNCATFFSLWVEGGLCFPHG